MSPYRASDGDSAPAPLPERWRVLPWHVLAAVVVTWIALAISLDLVPHGWVWTRGIVVVLSVPVLAVTALNMRGLRRWW